MNTCYCGNEVDSFSPDNTHCSVACFSYDPSLIKYESISRHDSLMSSESSKNQFKIDGIPYDLSILDAYCGFSLVKTRTDILEPSYQILEPKGTMPKEWN